MALASARRGLSEAFAAEIAHGHPGIAAWLQREIPAMHVKTGRWVAEMEGIASFAGETAGVAALFGGAGELFAMLDQAGVAPARLLDMVAARLGSAHT